VPFAGAAMSGLGQVDPAWLRRLDRAARRFARPAPVVARAAPVVAEAAAKGPVRARTAAAAVRNVSAFAKAARAILLEQEIRPKIPDAELQQLAIGAIAFGHVMKAMGRGVGTDTRVLQGLLASVSNLALVELSKRTGQAFRNLEAATKRAAAVELGGWPGVVAVGGVLSYDLPGAEHILSETAFKAAGAVVKMKPATDALRALLVARTAAAAPAALATAVAAAWQKFVKKE